MNKTKLLIDALVKARMAAAVLLLIAENTVANKEIMKPEDVKELKGIKNDLQEALCAVTELEKLAKVGVIYESAA